ncbi:hypothetical protein CVT25_006899 [Psilocybe cyanescens]|uniref:F-box domain-containing protein n=1 Tax=Psilocybe cyanescens TaxID=93625 RepID=A0A409X615_PSICY|nr:hypothetical protein CVT25_006899 [Psilocybe cyanescens]
MDSNDIPNDIWINVVELIDGSAPIAALVATSHRFQELGMKYLLRDLRWVEVDSTSSSIEAWKDYKAKMVYFPRKLTLSIAFEFGKPETSVSPTASKLLHNAVYSQISAFRCLYEIVLVKTVVSCYTHKALSSIPTLRLLTINDCLFTNFGKPFSVYSVSSVLEDLGTPLPCLSITHLSLNNPIFPNVDLDTWIILFRFLNGNNISGSTLSSLSITWTQELNSALSLFRDRLIDEDDYDEDYYEKWIFPKLVHLDFFIPSLIRRYHVSQMSAFSGVHCSTIPRIRISIGESRISENELRGLRSSMSGMWSYTGPYCIFLRFRFLANLTHLIITDPMEKIIDNLRRLPETLQSLDIKSQIGEEDGMAFATAIQDMFPVIHFVAIRYGIDRACIILSPSMLEIEISEWDTEALFTARYRFPDVHSLTIRYGGDAIKLTHRLIVSLGPDILFHMQHLHTFKLLHDVSIHKTIFLNNNSQHSVGPSRIGHPEYDPCDIELELEEDDMKDYLNAWGGNEYVKLKKIAK